MTFNNLEIFMLKKLLIGAVSITALSAAVVSASESGGTVKMVYCNSDDAFTFSTHQRKATHNGREHDLRFEVKKSHVGDTKFKMMYAGILHAQATGYSLWIGIDDGRSGSLNYQYGTSGHYTQSNIPIVKCSSISVNK